jgi:hypothetical protein
MHTVTVSPKYGINIKKIETISIFYIFLKSII